VVHPPLALDLVLQEPVEDVVRHLLALVERGAVVPAQVLGRLAQARGLLELVRDRGVRQLVVVEVDAHRLEDAQLRQQLRLLDHGLQEGLEEDVDRQRPEVPDLHERPDREQHHRGDEAADHFQHDFHGSPEPYFQPQD
jgi:hypothetical protein